MMIIYLVIAAISVASIYGFVVYKRQTKSDQELIDHLREDQDVELLRVQVVSEKIGEDNRIVDSRSADTEILIGHGFLVLTQPVLALHNKDICRDGVKGITWSVEIDKVVIAEDKSLEIESILPDDDTTHTHLIFKGMTDREIHLIKGRLLFPEKN